MISYDPISRCYRLGFGLYTLGHKAQQFSIRDTHRKSIEQIAEMTGDTVYLVEKALSSAPRSFVLAGREPRFDLKLDGEKSYICTAGTGVNVMDHTVGSLRASTKADLECITRVVDALPMISFMWSTVTSQDYGRIAPLHDCHAMLTNTLKHVRGGTAVFPELAGYIVEMAKVVAGGEDQLKKRPPINANICTIAPLSHDKHGIECALTYA